MGSKSSCPRLARSRELRQRLNGFDARMLALLLGVSRRKGLQAECKPCAVGRFSNETELTECFHCNSGESTDGQSGSASCSKCAAVQELRPEMSVWVRMSITV